LIADNLVWFEGKAKNIEQMAEQKGETIEKKQVIEIIPPSAKIGTDTNTKG